MKNGVLASNFQFELQNQNHYDQSSFWLNRAHIFIFTKPVELHLDRFKMNSPLSNLAQYINLLWLLLLSKKTSKNLSLSPKK